MTSSAAMMGKIQFDDLHCERSYKPIAAYAQSKLACLLFANQLGNIARTRNWPLLSTSAHPAIRVLICRQVARTWEQHRPVKN